MIEAPAPTPPGRDHREGRPWVADTIRRWPRAPRGVSGEVSREFPGSRMLLGHSKSRHLYQDEPPARRRL
ncbi:hypothetical protein E2C01_056140 [Portunus trituberculatus]|uniref:Uncharacterized protein n=1 Tax=Portunus trituberculatus TaxID=210409 RepID=A0A5B7GPL4_PORTR|nr:hypothetical protein [Portunus trituberculatus]